LGLLRVCVELVAGRDKLRQTILIAIVDAMMGEFFKSTRDRNGVINNLKIFGSRKRVLRV
jgi:hypothetical protein